LRVGLIIVTHHAAALVERCLRAVALQSRRPDRILVVDNASHDGTRTRVADVAASLALPVEIIEQRENVGFARANNLAVDALADCDWVALLNPDAYPEPAWLQSLLAATARHPAAAALSSRLMRDGVAEVLDGAGDEYHVSGLVWRRGHGQPLSRVAGALVERRVMAACAAAAIYRRQDWIDAGGFDARFFCYVEDVDLGFRLCLRGHECWYVPDAVAHHVGSATTGTGSAFAVYHGHRNVVWTFVKNMPGPLLARHLLGHLVVSVVGLAWFASRGRGRAYLAAKRDALRGLSWMWRARREVQRTRTVSVGEVRSLLNRESLVARLRAR
jgi:GT2 family glycosyltransferase